MAVPQRKVTKTRKAKRANHHAIKLPQLFPCNRCGKKILPHRVCAVCGYYKNKKVLNVEH